MQSVQMRSRVDDLLRSSPAAALRVALKIPHPWYRCQSLTEVARRGPGDGEAILRNALSAAKECHDENRRVVVACWPLREALQTKCRILAIQIVRYCEGQLARDKHPISRCCAAFDVLCTIRKAPHLVRSFYPAFRKATASGHGWKVDRCLKYLSEDVVITGYSAYKTYIEKRVAGIAEWKAWDAHRRAAARTR